MAKKTLVIALILAAGALAAKDKAWQTGTLLDNSLNGYFKDADFAGRANPADAPHIRATAGDYDVAVNADTTGSSVIYNRFVIDSPECAYLVELARLKSAKAPHLSLIKPVKFASEKNKFWFVDLDGQQYEGSVVKRVVKQAPGQEAVRAQAAPAPATAPAVPATATVPAPAKTQPQPVQIAAVQAPPVQTAPAIAALPAATVAPKEKPAASVRPKEPAKSRPEITPAKPAEKLEAKLEPRKPERKEAPKTIPIKDRAWQAGQLLSVASNKYFANVPYTSDSDASTWVLTPGPDGKYTLTGREASLSNSAFAYDSYVLESEFCAYLVQRARPRTSPVVAFPGTTPLRFAVEKNKLWILDEEGHEYETKVIKLVQKNAAPERAVQAAAR